MRWLVELRGNSADFLLLRAAFTAGPVRLTLFEGGWYIGGTVEVAETPVAAFDLAGEHLPLVNGIGFAAIPGYQPASLTGRIIDRDGGHNPTLVMGPITFNGRSLFGINGSADGARATALRRSTKSDAALTRAIHILGRSDCVDWVDLYKVFEVLVQAAGSESLLRQRTRAHKRDVSAFRYSANSPRVSGDLARHASEKGVKAGTHTMTLEEGRDFIRRLLVAW